ncbi:MAG TPA: hypothetical protein PLP33_29525 [Leptospiraceae bacterium]|nr:hypothetical protein [Leptospiraceae bacterium]
MTYNTGTNYTTSNGEKTSPGSFAIWPIALIIFLLGLGCWCAMPNHELSELLAGSSGGEFWRDLGNALGLID